MTQLLGKIYNKLKQIVFGKSKEVEALEMIFPVDAADPKKPEIKEDYLLRQFKEEDRLNYFELLKRAEMGDCPLDFWLNHILPEAFFVLEHKPSGSIVASCMASHFPNSRNPFGGNLGWLAVDPDHRGNKLAEFLICCVISSFRKAGYTKIYLGTQDFRLAAIKLYLKTNWIPHIFTNEMNMRWKTIYKNLGINQ